MSAPAMELRRAPQAPPTAPGWHYARLKGGDTVEPVEVIQGLRSRLIVSCAGRDLEDEITDFVWFGPVPVCVEATHEA